MCGSECFNELTRTVDEYLKGILIKLQLFSLFFLESFEKSNHAPFFSEILGNSTDKEEEKYPNSKKRKPSEAENKVSKHHH